MKDAKLLVIGAGIGQVPIIKKAKERGIHTSVVTLPGNQPGIPLADDVCYCDIYNRDEIVKWAKTHSITAVISDQNDLMNPTVAYVAEKLGIPGNTFDQVMSYCNKNTFRDNCDSIGIPTPKHIAINSIDFNCNDFDCPLPWIVKPADSQSSVGVQRIDKYEDLAPALEFAISQSKTHSAILEEFFVGHEIVCEGFIENGQYHLLSFADRKYFDLDNLLIPSQTVFPSIVKKELLDKVVEYETTMAHYINPAFAIVHSEYLVNEETGEIRVVESALRGGGVYISSDLIPMATGLDINNLLLDKVLGVDSCYNDYSSNIHFAASGYICFYLPEGTIDSIEGKEQLLELPFVRKAFIDDIKVGEQTQPMLHKGLRKGPILVSARNRQELEDNIITIQNVFKIGVKSPDGKEKHIIWK